MSTFCVFRRGGRTVLLGTRPLLPFGLALPRLRQGLGQQAGQDRRAPAARRRHVQRQYGLDVTGHRLLHVLQPHKGGQRLERLRQPGVAPVRLGKSDHKIEGRCVGGRVIRSHTLAVSYSYGSVPGLRTFIVIGDRV